MTTLVAAHAQAPADLLKPCSVPEPARPARCGTFTVPETRGASDGRTIPLRIIVVPAAKRVDDEPIVFIAGGPGQGAAEIAGFILQQLQGLDEGRDVVFVDQRGTGRSNPLTCAGGFDLLSRSRRNDLVTCVATLRRRANLNAYGTDEAVQDLEQVRTTLGYDRIHVIAASYGTRPALEYMHRHPDRVSTAILRAVRAARIQHHRGRQHQRGVSTAAAGDVHAHLRAVREKVAANPAGAPITLPNGKTVVLTEALLGQVLYALLLNADSRQQVPLLLKRATTDGLAYWGRSRSRSRSRFMVACRSGCTCPWSAGRMRNGRPPGSVSG